MTPRIAVVGTGANGGAIAADLTSAGHDVTMIEQWSAHVEAMRANGLTVTGPAGSRTTTVNAHHLSDVATFRDAFDVVFVAVKAYDTRWACELIKPLMTPDSVIVGVQNGMTVGDMSEIVGPERALGCVIEVAANMFEPGRIEQEVPMWFALGAVDPRADRHVERVAGLLADVGTVETTSDILSAKWMKIVANACELVPSAILGLPLAAAIRLPGMYEFMQLAGQEAARTAVDLGHSLVPIFGVEGDTSDPDAFATALLDGVLATYTLSDTKTTVLQDWLKGRRAEADDINGVVVRERRRLGGSAPANHRILELAQAIEAGRLEMGPENVDAMLDVLGPP